MPDPTGLLHRHGRTGLGHVDTYGSGKLSDTELATLTRKVFPLSPKGMIDHLDLRRPIYSRTATYGHFGRDDPEYTWERLDAVDELRAKAAQLGEGKRRGG
jgi:S-adenosylmethionine synthetase